MNEVRVILTIVLQLEEQNIQDKLIEIQNRIKDMPEIREFGFNIYDILEVPNA